MQQLDILNGQELWSEGHLASLRKVRSCLRTTLL
jgi:hypothetical protein